MDPWNGLDDAIVVVDTVEKFKRTLFENGY